jgi:hypothetical protein
MDVVDTLRHRDDFVARELDDERRAADLIERLRRIYAGQGIAVPDRILQEGVNALKENRFVYDPPRPGLARTLATLWVRRARWGKAVAGLALAVLAGWAVWQVAVVGPTRRAEERTRIELAQTLPEGLARTHGEVMREAQVAEPRQRADALLADGRAALARADADGARKALAGLEGLKAELLREYSLRIVSRPGEASGVWRIPGRNPNARNYYVIVEAVAPDGRKLALPVANEETGQTDTVDRWAVRVTPETFEAVRRDKNDDGIVQRNRLGEKRRGRLDVEWATPVPGGAITRW